jgi:hypothetical protein
MRRLSLLLPLMAACTDYDVNALGKPNPGGADDTADPGGEAGGDGGGGGGTDGGDDGDTTVPDEECNGIDDDLDGRVDEDFPDTDGDGVADCVDEDCVVDTASAAAVTVDDTCIAPEAVVPDPWNVAIEWQWTGLSSNPTISQVISTPVVGALLDTDGDGDVDVNDAPSVVFTAFSGYGGDGHIVALDGRTGAEQWAVRGANGYGGAGLADVDGDGRTDVVYIDASGYPKALRGDGSALWSSTTRITYSTYPQVAFADLDGDGTVEVLAQDVVLDGATGAARLTGIVPTSYVPYWIPTAADLDQDGYQEIIMGDTVFSHTGAYLWRSAFAGSYGHWAAVINADADPEAEIAMIGGGYLGVYNHDGTEISRTAVGAAQPGAPCVADFDGDGAAEIAWASQNTLQMTELNGTRVWSQAVSDYSGLASCSGYDVDGDGIYEVLYADENSFNIHDGATGAIRFTQGGHASGTLWEYPAIADIDADGSAEVVIASNNYSYSGWAGVTVFGHAGSGWRRSGPAWQVHDFAVTNINPDGSVPASPTPSWQAYNVFRARPSVDTAALDLTAAFVDVCAASCEPGGLVEATVQLANLGGVDSSPDVSVALYADDGGSLRLIAAQVRPGVIRSGWSTDSLSFTFPVEELGSSGLVVVVDDDGAGVGAQDECDESGNAAAWTAPVCP